MERVTNLIRITSNPKLKMSVEGDFFKCWVEFLKPVHKLTKREMGVLTEFLKVRYELSKSIIDTDILDRMLMSKETTAEIRKTCGLSTKHFQVIKTKFRKNGVFYKDSTGHERIYLNLIPHITEEGVGLMIHFSFKDEQHIKLGPQKSVQKA